MKSYKPIWFFIIFVLLILDIWSAENLIVQAWDNGTSINPGQTVFSARNVRLSSSGTTVGGSLAYEVFDRYNPTAIVQLFIAVEREVAAVVYNGIPGSSGRSGTKEFSFIFDPRRHGKKATIYLAGTWARGVDSGKYHYERENGGWRCAIGTITVQEFDEPELLMFPVVNRAQFSEYTFQLNPAAVALVADDYFQAEQYMRKIIWAISEEKFQGAHDAVFIAMAISIAKHSYELFSNAKNYRGQILQIQLNVDNQAVALVQGLTPIIKAMDAVLTYLNVLKASQMIQEIPAGVKRLI
jgi:hypothetical protein